MNSALRPRSVPHGRCPMSMRWPVRAGPREQPRVRSVGRTRWRPSSSRPERGCKADRFRSHYGQFWGVDRARAVTGRGLDNDGGSTSQARLRGAGLCSDTIPRHYVVIVARSSKLSTSGLFWSAGGLVPVWPQSGDPPFRGPPATGPGTLSRPRLLAR
jgi:hypothetical protein